MSPELAAELAGYAPGSVTVRVVQAVLAAIPGEPPGTPYTSLEQAAGDAPDAVLARARELAGGPAVAQALTAARSIDTGDAGITVISGVRSALALFFGGREQRATALAQQQRADAGLKALALGYLVTRLVPLPPAERVALVRSVPAGRELLTWYGAIEIALPFAAEVAAGEGRFVRGLLEGQGGSIADPLLGVVGRQGVADAQQTLVHLGAALDEAASRAAPHAASLAERVRALLPASGLGGELFDLVAAGADALPAYRYLCARLAVEASLALARGEQVVEAPPPPPVPPELAAAALPATGPDPFADEPG